MPTINIDVIQKSLIINGQRFYAHPWVHDCPLDIPLAAFAWTRIAEIITDYETTSQRVLAKKHHVSIEAMKRLLHTVVGKRSRGGYRASHRARRTA